MAQRPADFDLAAQLARPNFTPGRGDAAALAALIAEGAHPTAARATTALAGLREVGRAALDAAIAGAAEDGAHARLIAALGVHARGGDEAAAAGLHAALGHGAARVRKAAAVALGKLGGEPAAAALVARWDASDGGPAPVPEERRALAEALGKVGGDAARARLAELEPGADKELLRRRDRARLMADRGARRGEDSEVATDVAPPSPVVVELETRIGLAPLLAEELTALGLAPVRRGDDVEVVLAGPLSGLFASRLWTTAAVRVPLAVAPGARADGVARAIVAALTAPATRALLAAWTRGPVRWRLGFARGHQRALVWQVARDVTAAAPELVNDPTATTWDVLVADDARSLALVPRRFVDPRFAWRVAELPAGSHPTVAATLAWLAGTHRDDRVWDPFCGAGSELIECAVRGTLRSLTGTDIDADALTAAQANLAAAGVTAALHRADARTHDPGPVELIVTNPPLGSRVQLDAAQLLLDALPNFARALVPGGRLVWITPAARRTTPAAASLGLRCAVTIPVDLGGVRGRIERWDR